MEQLVQEKVKRFVELSVEFSVKEDEVYRDVDVRNKTISFHHGHYHAIDMVAYGTEPPVTKIEIFESELKSRMEKARRFEEYISLQKDLGAYFESLSKLNS